MIRFIKVVGHVQVDDIKGQRTLAPSGGMTMPSASADCLIATGNPGEVTLSVNGDPVVLKARSFLRIRPHGRPFIHQHLENLAGDVDDALGRLWAIVCREMGEPNKNPRIKTGTQGIRG